MLERRQHPGFRRHGRVTGEQSCLELVGVVPRLEPVAQYQRPAQAADLDLIRRLAAFVVALDYWDLDAQQPPLAGLGVEKTHEAVTGNQ